MTNEKLVDERFRIISLAGKGGMGEVYRARDQVTARDVALKLFTERDAEAAGRFSREAEALQRLEHPAIVTHVAHGFATDGTPYLAMEWLAGEDLSDRLVRGPLSVQETITLGTRIAGALAAAHAIGIVHRDIKPSNVYLQRKEVSGAKLLDFGLARTQGGASFTRAGEALGTPAYMAPEQAKGNTVDARADLFSLGCVLFECLAGKPPFWADHPLAVMAKILLDKTPELGRDDVPPALVSLIERLLAKEPDERPKNGSELLAALEAIAGPKPRAPTDTPMSSAPSSTPASLAARERQLLSVVFVGRVADTVAEEHEAVNPTLFADSSSGEIDSVFAAVLKFGGWAERLVEGTIVITLPGRGSIGDQAAAAAKCALTVRRAMPTHPMALVTGRTSGHEGFPVGEVIDRGVRLLSAEMTRRAPEVADRPRRIAVDDVTAGLLDRRFALEGEGTGLALVGEREAKALERTLLGKPTPFVGRDRETSMLTKLYDGCVSEQRAAAVLLEGPAGFGKSRLRQEVLRVLETRIPTPTVLVGGGDPTRKATALGAAASALIELFGIREGEGGEVSRHRVRARVGRHVKRADRDRVTAFLGELVGVPFPEETSELLAVVRADPARTGDQIRAAWEDFIAAELAAGPVILVMEDLHAADAQSVALIEGTLRTFADRQLFVLALARPEIDQNYPRLWSERSLVRINLRGLSADASRKMVESALGEGADARLVNRIIARADGNAFFVEELVRAVAAGREDHMPQTVVAMAASTLEALSQEGRRVLRAASVIGMEFTVGALSAILRDIQETELGAIISDLVEREILIAPSRIDVSLRSVPYTFSSELLRTAAYEQLTEEDRAMAHCLAAEWLEATAGPRDASAVADHFDRAGESRRAAIWYARAAEIALGQGDFREAIERGDRGAVAGASGALLGRTRLLQAEALRHLGDNQTMLDRAQEAMSLLPDRTPGWWMAAADAVLGATRTGAKDIVDRLASDLTSTPPAPSPSVARVAVYLMHVGKNDEARRALAVVRTALKDPAEPAAKWGWGHRANAYAAMFAGDIAGYLDHAERAASSFHAGGDTRELAQELVGLGYARHELGMYEEAERSLTEGKKIAERLGLRHTLAAALENLGGVLHRLGRLGEAEDAFGDALRLFRAQQNRRMEGHCRKQLGLVLLDRGNAERAFDEIMHASQLLSTFPPLIPACLAAGARALAALERTDDALLMARDAAAMLADQKTVEEGEAFIRLTLAELLDAAGDPEAARAAVGAARERLLDKAAKITNADYKKTFLNDVRENAKTLALAGKWLKN